MLALTAEDELVSTQNEHSHDVRSGIVEENRIMHQKKMPSSKWYLLKALSEQQTTLKAGISG